MKKVTILSILVLMSACSNHAKKPAKYICTPKVKEDLADSKVQYNMGARYENGCKVEKNYDKAVEWYTKSAKQGYIPAINTLGNIYDHGVGAYGKKPLYINLVNPNEAVKWYTKSSNKGDPEGEYGLATIYDKLGKLKQHKYDQAYNNLSNVDKILLQGYRDGIELNNSINNMSSGSTQTQVIWSKPSDDDYKKAFNLYEESANQDYAPAENNLAYMYAHGHGVHFNLEQAIDLYEKAINQGYAEATNNLGDLYYNNYKIDKALSLYKKSAFKGDPLGMNNLGFFYDHMKGGKFLSENLKQAIYWYTKSANLGDVKAQNILGDKYFYGEGTEEDIKQAIYWYTRSANQGNISAKKSLKYLASQGIDQDQAMEEKATQDQAQKNQDKSKKALDLYTKSANNGDVQAQKKLADMYEHGNGVPLDYEKAIKLYKKLAEKGDADAQNHLGDLYNKNFRNGQNYDRKTEPDYWYAKSADQGNAQGQFDLAKYDYHYYKYQNALSLLTKAANQGHKDAIFDLGYVYEHGTKDKDPKENITKDPKKALKFYTQALKLGSAKAQGYFGSRYYYGKADGVTKDYKKAFDFYEKSANQGSMSSAYTLGFMYHHGQGVAKDMKKAIFWYRKSAYHMDISSLRNFWSSSSQKALASIYTYGQDGIKKDPKKAKYWNKMVDKILTLQVGHNYAYNFDIDGYE